MDKVTRLAVIEHLATFISNEKRATIEAVMPLRTRHLTVVLEDIYQPQNASAVLRTCECFGVQDLHVIENRNQFKTRKAVVQGASKWIDLHRYNAEGGKNTMACLRQLKASGYQIAATTLHDQAISPAKLDLTRKTALVFGNEEKGISTLVEQHADVFLKYPMYGFTQSFNISVSAALFISMLIERLHHSEIAWQLDEEALGLLRLQWYAKAVDREERVQKIIERFLNERAELP